MASVEDLRVWIEPCGSDPPRWSLALRDGFGVMVDVQFSIPTPVLRDCKNNAEVIAAWADSARLAISEACDDASLLEEGSG